jgi:hypothetical protein
MVEAPNAWLKDRRGLRRFARRGLAAVQAELSLASAVTTCSRSPPTAPIVVLVDGRITEAGTHEQLLRRERDYWSLYRSTNSIITRDPSTLAVVPTTKADRST